MNYPIYLDYNATTPCHPEVIQAMLPFFGTHLGNAASNSHPYGWVAADAVDKAREQVARLLGVRTKEIIFTSGATESINLAIKGIFQACPEKKQHFITCQTEHKAVLDTLAEIEKSGAEVTYLPVNSEGAIDLDHLEKAIRPETKMICVMWANNETGIIHPIEKIAEIAEKHQIIFFVDAVQAVGKIPVFGKGIHMMAISAHKMYGPKGVGALYIRHNHPLQKPLAQIQGGGHEKGFRSGTLNVPGIVGMGKAAEIRLLTMDEESTKLKTLRNLLEDRLLNIPDTFLNGSQEARLAHVTNIAFDRVAGEELLRKVCLKVALSSGSACSSISPRPSHVLKAMGLNSDLGKASLRFSLGSQTSEIDILNTLDWVQSVVEELRGERVGLKSSKSQII